jgi:hypothetical protein
MLVLFVVIVSMVVVLGEGECTPHDEARLVSNFTTFVRDVPIEQREETLRELFKRCTSLQREQMLAAIGAGPQIWPQIGTDNELICLKNRNGLTAFFFSRTYAALKRLREMQLSGSLNGFFENVISLLLDCRKISVRSVEWDAASFDRYVKHFKTIQGYVDVRKRVTLVC